MSLCPHRLVAKRTRASLTGHCDAQMGQQNRRVQLSYHRRNVAESRVIDSGCCAMGAQSCG